MKRSFVVSRAACATAVLCLSACGDTPTAPDSAPPFRPAAAVGTDPISGATIETDRDDYMPGEIVHVTGRGWAPGEIVELHMTEEPDTHADVTQDVRADDAGEFSVHFYDVQPHDRGVTFTLTATGRTSGARATAIFTDGSTVLFILALDPASPAANGSFDVAIEVDIGGSGNNRTWKATAWWIDGGSATCVNTPDVVDVNGDHLLTLTGLTAPATPGAHTLFMQLYADDACGERAGGEKELPFTVAGSGNSLPVVDAGTSYAGGEGVAIAISGTASDSDGSISSTLWSIDPDDGICSIDDATLLATSVTCSDNGAWTLSLRATDEDGGISTATAGLTVTNVDPTATFTPPDPVNEGIAFNLVLTDADDVAGDEPTLRYAFLCDANDPALLAAYAALTYASASASATASCATSDDGPRSVRAKVLDKDGGESEYSGSVTINDIVPAIAGVVPGSSLPAQLVSGVASTGITVNFTGYAGDVFNGRIYCDDDVAVASFASAVTLSSFSHTCVYNATGVYTVKVTVQDDDGSATDATAYYQYVIVFDPTAGFVTGGGWIQSQQGFCKDPVFCPYASGRGHFGFVSKYLKGATVPTGNTEFQLQAGDFNFKSANYEWLVVNQGGSNAQFKGTGTINGGGSFKFQIWATDNATDRFRIRIWRESGGVEYDIFDNGSEQLLNGTDGSGSIQIHVPKK